MSPETRDAMLRALNLMGHGAFTETHGGVAALVIRNATTDLKAVCECLCPTSDQGLSVEEAYIALEGILGRLEAGMEVADAVALGERPEWSGLREAAE